MIRSIEIKGYRGFAQYEVVDLGRVNLLVGRNNSGKTSVLEAIDLLASGTAAFALWRIVSRRGERVFVESNARPSRAESEYEVSHLFYGHELRIGQEFSVAIKNEAMSQVLKCQIQEAPKDAQVPLIMSGSEEAGASSVVINFAGRPAPSVKFLPLSRRGGLTDASMDFARTRRTPGATAEPTSQFITTESLASPYLAAMWNQIALTDAQDRVVNALRFIEPTIEAIAPQISTAPYFYDTRGGFIVKMRGLKQPVPIGSLGDGIWRMLALAIAMSRAKDGILLVDEIDTGLHYSVMESMWKLIAETAKALNVQVFATTHSYDCVYSLSRICHADVMSGSDVTLQRVDPQKGRAVRFTEAEIRVAAERQIEVR